MKTASLRRSRRAASRCWRRRNTLWVYERACTTRAADRLAGRQGPLPSSGDPGPCRAGARAGGRRDTAAFGALMRGPLVGLTDQALLDITAALPDENGRPGVFSVARRAIRSPIPSSGPWSKAASPGAGATTPCSCWGRRSSAWGARSAANATRGTRALANVESCWSGPHATAFAAYAGWPPISTRTGGRARRPGRPRRR